MKLSILIVALTLVTPAMAVEGGGAASRCSVTNLKRPALAIPAGIARDRDKVCQAAVWEYLDIQGEKILYANTQYSIKKVFLDAGTSTDQEAAIKDQQEILKSLAAQFDAVDAKVKEIGATVEGMKGDLKSLTAAGGASVEQVAAAQKALESLLAKEGDDLAVEYAPNQPITPVSKPLVGGKSFDTFVSQMLELSGGELVKKHLPAMNAVGKNAALYAAGSKSFSWGDIERLWVEKGDLIANKPLSVTGAEFCKGQGALPAFCAIDKEQGKKVRELFLEARKVVNAANQHVLKTPGKTVAEISAGLEKAAKAAKEPPKADERFTARESAFKKSVEAAQSKGFDGAARTAGLDPQASVAGMGELRGQKVASGRPVSTIRKDGANVTEIYEYVDGNGKAIARAEVPQGASETQANAAFDAAAETVAQSLSGDQTLKGELQTIAAAMKGSVPDDPMNTESAACDNPLETYNSEQESKLKGEAAKRSKARKDARGKRDERVDDLEDARDKALDVCEKA
ncbi:MAG: hypothetical protein WC943_08405, partial [Elusimicrobiota bacterium]